MRNKTSIFSTYQEVEKNYYGDIVKVKQWSNLSIENWEQQKRIFLAQRRKKAPPGILFDEFIQLEKDYFNVGVWSPLESVLKNRYFTLLDNAQDPKQLRELFNGVEAFDLFLQTLRGLKPPAVVGYSWTGERPNNLLAVCIDLFKSEGYLNESTTMRAFAAAFSREIMKKELKTSSIKMLPKNSEDVKAEVIRVIESIKNNHL